MITTHILDIATGGPAVGLAVTLDVRRGEQWVRVSAGQSDEQGRVTSLTDNQAVTAGTYRLTFDTGAYHRGRGVASFFPEAQVVFEVRDASEHYHVPLLITPFGYSTYRGT